MVEGEHSERFRPHNNLTNIQPGHHSGYFRAKDDWEKRTGFDLPFVVNPGTRADRTEKLDLMIGEGLELEGLPRN